MENPIGNFFPYGFSPTVLMVLRLQQEQEWEAWLGSIEESLWHMSVLKHCLWETELELLRELCLKGSPSLRLYGEPFGENLSDTTREVATTANVYVKQESRHQRNHGCCKGVHFGQG
jgi:hypothetical protein